MWRGIFLLVLSVVSITRCERRLSRRRKHTEDTALFNFMPELRKERAYQDVTYNVLSVLDDISLSREPRTRDHNAADSSTQNNQVRIHQPAVPQEKPSDVDCSATPLPTKQKKKVRKWVHKYSQHCKQPRGQFRYPDNCHAYIDCWDGYGRLQHCHPRTLVFNERTKACDWERNVPCVNGEVETSASTELDIDQPDCASYAGLGYKCVNFWDCSQDNKIIDNPGDFYGEGFIDARMTPPQKRTVPAGQFDPLSKVCPGTYETCCKGNCKSLTLTPAQPNQLQKSESSLLCPGDYIGSRPIPGICTKFAECYKGKAVIKDCPPGTHFCIHSLMCDWPRKVVCDQLATLTTASPVTQSDGPTGSGFEYPSSSLPPLDLQGMARKIDIIPAPPSGQIIRLRQGRSPTEGYLQIFNDNKWGFVCDSGTWTMDEANIVCSQLGLKRGVRKTTQGLVHGPADEDKKATESVECSGSEDQISECSVSYTPASRPCKLSEDIVSVSCLPDSWATCDEGELPWGSSCYSFFPNESSFDNAQEACKRQGKYLVEIESQEENDMLSELLFQNSKVTNIMNEVWTGGVGSNIARKNVWFWHSDTDKLMEYRNFWKGWSGGERSSLEIRDNFAQGIKMSRQFPLVKKSNKKKISQLTDYYFWSLENFNTKLTYICERPQQNIGCIQGEGETYKGLAKRTKFGDSCKPWESPEINFWFDQEQIGKLGPLKNNNFCRNPDEAEAPWCLIGEGEYELCDIPSCEDRGNNLPMHETSCKSDQFECTPGECIFNGYVCDGDYDCSNRADENPKAKCQTYTDSFKEVSNVRLNVKEAERWTNRNLNACLRTCIMSKDITCKGVNFMPEEKTCVILEYNVGMSGMLEEDFKWTYFERIDTQTTCSSNTMCQSGKCLDSSQFCDGKYDCPDRSDEARCGTTPNVQVRLVQGKTPNEGRVEIKAFEHNWGGICDDGFGIQEANIICKEAGFSLGALEAVLHSTYGSGNEINLDELDCTGNENSVLECKFNPWKEHDCSAKEYAGVICRDETKACLDEEWKCKTGECINLDFLCDTTEDCSDGSDEIDDQCGKDVTVRLVGGNNVTSGRVEVKYKEVWGTMCDDNFGVEEGRVICKMLGFPGGVKLHPEAAFGPGEGPIWIKDIMCNGNESTLSECPSPAWGPSYQCKHLEDIGVECLLSSEDSDTIKSAVSQESSIEQCGVSDVLFKPTAPIAKVAGGQTAAPGSQPWTASIRVRGSTRSFHWCGAVVVSEIFIVTAAHCVEDYPKDVYVVRVGDWDQDVEDIDEQEFSIENVHFHSEFNVGTYLNNDIALLKLKTIAGKGIKFGQRVKPACLPPPRTAYTPGMECTISGWGSLGQGSGGYSRRLQAVKVPLLPTSECIQKHVYGPDKLSGGMFCAGFLEGGVDSCQGDSGGPMVCELRGKSTLLGVISWGYGCGRPNKPGVYTKVVDYLDWLEVMMKEK